MDYKWCRQGESLATVENPPQAQFNRRQRDLPPPPTFIQHFVSTTLILEDKF